MKQSQPPRLKTILASAFLIALAFLAFLQECSAQRVSDVGIARASVAGFVTSFRNMGSDTLGMDMGAEFLIGGSMFQVPNFTEPSSEQWKHLILGAALMFHGPRWADSHILAYVKGGGMLVIGQEDIPGLGFEGSGNLSIIQLGVGADYAISPRLSISGELLPTLEWATFNGDLAFLNQAPFRDRSEFRPLTFTIRFSMAFSNIIPQ